MVTCGYTGKHLGFGKHRPEKAGARPCHEPACLCFCPGLQRPASEWGHQTLVQMRAPRGPPLGGVLNESAQDTSDRGSELGLAGRRHTLREAQEGSRASHCHLASHYGQRALFNTPVLSCALAELGCLDSCHCLGGFHVDWGLLSSDPSLEGMLQVYLPAAHVVN